MRASTLDLRQGNYQKAIDRVRGLERPTAEDLTARLGAHAFLGQIEEATTLWQAHEAEFDLRARVAARFFLGIALTRISKFKRAFAVLSANMNEANDAGTRAFAFQGAGFYSYFRGNFARALHFSRKALAEAEKSRETYVQFLAMDLLGHATVQAGQRSRGLRLIEDASRLALAQGNRNFAAAFTNARLTYEAEVGLRPATIVSELEEAIGTARSTDSYTRGNLVLELARQKTLRGQFEDAKGWLNREALSIYSYANRRQEVMLQLRLAEIAHHQGEFYLMSHILQSAKKTVSLLADKAFEIRWLGLTLKLPESISPGVAERARLAEIARTHSSRINRQMLARQGAHEDPKTPSGEDPLHDLLSLDREAAIARALDLGYFGLYRQLAKIDPGVWFLQVHERGLLLGTPAGIELIGASLSNLQLKLIQQLARDGSKEELIRRVWGYTYDSLRHDSLLHNAIGKLRKIFGRHGEWVVTTERGWQLDSRVRLFWSIPEAPKPTGESAYASEPFADDLNFRQIRALKLAPADTGWSVGSYKKAFGVSTMTAFRDLSHLHAKGLVIRTGKGRACRYLSRKGSES